MIIGGISRAAAGGRRYRGRGSRGGIDPLVVLWGLEAMSQASRGRGGWGGGGFGGFGGGGGCGGGGGFRAVAVRSAAAVRGAAGDTMNEVDHAKVSAAIAAAESGTTARWSR